jgi:hypothetical protein
VVGAWWWWLPDDLRELPIFQGEVPKLASNPLLRPIPDTRQAAVYRLQGEKMNIDDRLKNWSRYFRDRMKRECCASIEGRMYHAPWRQWVELSDMPMPEPIAWRAMMGKSKLILKFTYMANMPSFVVARRCKIKPYQMDETLRNAKKYLLDILAEHEKACYKTSNNLNRTRARESSAIDAGFLRPEKEPA